jgi:hypothetical protein
MGAVSLNRFVLTQTYTIPAGTLATPVAGEPGTGGAAGYGNSGTAAGQAGATFAQTITAGTPIMLDSGTPSALYTLLNGASVIRAYVPGQDDVSHAAVSN